MIDEMIWLIMREAKGFRSMYYIILLQLNGPEHSSKTPVQLGNLITSFLFELYIGYLPVQ